MRNGPFETRSACENLNWDKDCCKRRNCIFDTLRPLDPFSKVIPENFPSHLKITIWLKSQNSQSIIVTQAQWRKFDRQIHWIPASSRNHVDYGNFLRFTKHLTCFNLFLFTSAWQFFHLPHAPLRMRFSTHLLRFFYAFVDEFLRFLMRLHRVNQTVIAHGLYRACQWNPCVLLIF